MVINSDSIYTLILFKTSSEFYNVALSAMSNIYTLFLFFFFITQSDKICERMNSDKYPPCTFTHKSMKITK